MGMDYYLYSDLGSYPDHGFPEKLSYFFEQLGGYGERSLVAQTEKLLNIDLGLFQKTSHPEGGSTFIALAVLQKLVAELIEKVRANPGFIKQLRFAPAPGFPPNTGYFESTAPILKDLDVLEKSLSALKKAGATKIKLMYM